MDGYAIGQGFKGLSQGLMQGAQLGQQIRQKSAQEKRQAWEDDLSTFNVILGTAKGMNPTQKTELFKRLGKTEFKHPLFNNLIQAMEYAPDDSMKQIERLYSDVLKDVKDGRPMSEVAIKLEGLRGFGVDGTTIDALRKAVGEDAKEVKGKSDLRNAFSGLTGQSPISKEVVGSRPKDNPMYGLLGPGASVLQDKPTDEFRKFQAKDILQKRGWSDSAISGPTPPKPSALKEKIGILDRQLKAKKITQRQYDDSLLELAVKSGRTDVTVNIGQNVEKSVKAKIEREIIDGEKTLNRFSEIGPLFRDEFLEYKGGAKRFAANTLNKLGFINESDYLEKYNTWYTSSKTLSLEYRKFITGVAGGEKEMREIMGSIADPDKDSPIAYKAKLRRQKGILKGTVEKLRQMRTIGIEPTQEQKRQILEQEAVANPFDEGLVNKYDIELSQQ